MPEGITQIGMGAFHSNTSITQIYLPSTLSVINNFAFVNANLIAIHIPNSVTRIGNGAFSGAALGRVDFESGSRQLTIAEGAFSGTRSLRHIEIPGRVTSIGNHAFLSSGIEGVTFGPGNLGLSIGDGAFAFCAGLTSITLSNRVVSVGRDAFLSSYRLTIFAEALSKPAGWDAGFNPSDRPVYFGRVQSGNAVFALRGTGAVLIRHMGTGSFFEVPNMVSIGGSSRVVRYIGDRAFYRTTLNRVVIHGMLRQIGSYAFAYSSVASVEFGAGSVLEHIGGGAFEGSRLSTVEIPASVRFVGSRAFAYIPSLTGVVIAPNSRLTAIGNHAFEGASLTTITVPRNVERIGRSAFANSGLGSVCFEDGSALVSIGDYAFWNTNLRSIDLPSGLREIGERAFSRNNLVSIVIPRGVEAIGFGAFRDNRDLVSAIIPDSVLRIGLTAFLDCRNLTIFVEEGSNQAGWQIGRPGTISGDSGEWNGMRPVIRASLSAGGTYVTSILRTSYNGLSELRPCRADYELAGWSTVEDSLEVEYTVYTARFAPVGTRLFAIWYPVVAYKLPNKSSVGLVEISSPYEQAWAALGGRIIREIAYNDREAGREVSFGYVKSLQKLNKNICRIY